MKQRHWTKELSRILILLAIGGLIGLVSGYLWLSLFLFAGAYIGWSLWQLKRIDDWLRRNDDSHPPETIGFWGIVCDRLFYFQRKHQRAKAQLRHELDQFHNSLSSLSEAVVLVDEQGLIAWCNASAQRNLGLRFPSDEGQSILNFLRDPSFIAFYESEGKDNEQVQIAAPVDNDRMLAVQISHFGDGNRLIFARDITEIQRLEQMRLDFVSNVSHELRTPLTVLMGYIENFEQFSAELPRMAAPLQQMSQHALRMESLLRDLLELSRLDTLPHEMHNTVVSMPRLVQMVCDEARLSSVGAGRQIVMTAPEELIIFGKQSELHIAMLNLIINALKYSPADTIVEVALLQLDTGLEFSVLDHGVGIDLLHIPRLTERFYRVDPSRANDRGGTGLGLALVKRVLSHHDAELVVSSQLGKGSRFSFVIPAHRITQAVNIDQLSRQLQQ